MLIYYDDHVIITKSTLTYGEWLKGSSNSIKRIYKSDHILSVDTLLSYGQREIMLVGPVVKIYCVNDFVLICCIGGIYVYCKKIRRHKFIAGFKHFVINFVDDTVVIIDPTNSCLEIRLNAIRLSRVGPELMIETHISWPVHLLEDDLDPVSLHVVSKGLFQSPTDILIYCSH